MAAGAATITVSPPAAAEVETVVAQQRAALDLLDQLLEAPDNVVRFAMARGDLFWINNRRLAHNRTAYRDTPGNVRQLQRMWIQA